MSTVLKILVLRCTCAALVAPGRVPRRYYRRSRRLSLRASRGPQWCPSLGIPRHRVSTQMQIVRRNEARLLVLVPADSGEQVLAMRL